jgi:hypothetical protein
MKAPIQNPVQPPSQKLRLAVIASALLFLVQADRVTRLAQAADLYVDANAAAGGDGSTTSPYALITDAVGRARQLRSSAAIPATERVAIHVAAGNYVGTFNATALASNPNQEALPIILNVPNLTLAGATVMDHDSRGLPTGPGNGPQSKLKSSDLTDSDHQALIVVGRTSDGNAGDGVTVSGFIFGENNEGLGIVVDRVFDFALLDNAFIHTFIAIITRLSSGVVDGNYFLGNSGIGPGIGGGSINHPAKVTLSRNRSTKTYNSGADIRGEPSLRALDLGANTLTLEPLQLLFDRNSPQDAANIPDTLDVLVSNNDFSGNGTSGLVCFAYAFNPLFGYTTADPSQPKTSVIQATVVGNTFNGNGAYGFLAEAGGSLRSNPRALTRTLAGTFTQNTLQGNGRAGTLFDFIAADVSLGAASIQSFKYLQNSSYQLTDLDGELAGFDYDNPATDPVSGTVLNNTLSVNGAVIPSGTKISPLHP